MSRKEGYTPHPFDAENGVQTSGLIPGRYLKTGHTHDRHSTAYFGVAPSVFRALSEAMAADEAGGAHRETSRSSILERAWAAPCCWRRNIPFAKSSESNSTRLLRRDSPAAISTIWKSADRARAPMQIVCGDAVDARFPTGPCLVFLFNPFGAAGDAPAVAASCPISLRIVPDNSIFSTSTTSRIM